jgi:RNA 2',3'-cyclic 3'-phosphodiesterase
MIRAFIAVELPDALRQQIGRVQQQLRDQLGREASGTIRIAWVKPASMHLTLKFIGDFDEARVEALRDAMARATREAAPLRIPLARLGVFPTPREPRSLWIGAPTDWTTGAEAGQLAALVRAIEDCCAAAGVAREARPFTPHLTLGRVKAGERQAGRALTTAGALERPLTLDALPVNAFTLMKSRLDSDGAVHTPLWEIRLESRAP